MSELETPRPPGTHRRQRGSRLGVLLISLLVALLVGAGVYLVLKWRGESSHPSRSATSATPSTTPTTVASVGASASGLASPATSQIGSPAQSATPSISALASPSATPVPSPTPTPPPVLADKVPLDVLNATHVSGVAAKAARTFRSGGWVVSKTGNYGHTISITTVYYPAGERGSALRLAGQFPGIRRVAAAPSGLSATHLTVVLARDWL